MGYQLGVDIGTSYTAAAVDRGSAAEVVTLTPSNPVMPSVVLLKAGGDVLVGDAAVRRGIDEPSRVAREFKRRLGDPTPLVLGGTPYGAEALMGYLLAEVVRVVTEREAAGPDRVVLTHPANYGPYKLDQMREVARLAGVDIARVAFISEPEAAAISYASANRVEPGEVVAVYDFGGGTFDAALVRREGDGFALIGRPEGMDRLGGIDIDAAILEHVDSVLGGRIGALDPDDPAVQSGVARLNDDCRLAKEALSTDVDTAIAVNLPGVQGRVTLSRTQLEAMIRPRVGETIDALVRAVATADLGIADVGRVLLVGGSSRIPLIATMVRERTGRPVSLDAHPKFAIATGAATQGASRGADRGVSPEANLPPVAPADRATGTASSPPPSSPPPSSPPPSSPPPSSPPPPPPSAAGRRRRNIVIAAVAAAALIIAAIVLVAGGGDDPDTTASGSTSAPVPAPRSTVDGTSPRTSATIATPAPSAATTLPTTLPATLPATVAVSTTLPATLPATVTVSAAVPVTAASTFTDRIGFVGATSAGPFRIEVTKAEITGTAGARTAVVHTRITNIAVRDTYLGLVKQPSIVLTDGSSIQASFRSMPTIPGGGTTPVDIVVRVDDVFTFTGAALVFGNAASNQTIIPFDQATKVSAFVPITGVGKGTTVDSGTGTVATIADGILHADYADGSKDSFQLELLIDVTYNDPSDARLSDIQQTFTLTLPDGTSASSTYIASVVFAHGSQIVDSGSTEKMALLFEGSGPVAGPYTLTIGHQRSVPPNPKGSMPLTFTVAQP